MASITEKMESVTFAVQHETASLRSDFYTAFNGLCELMLRNGHGCTASASKPHGPYSKPSFNTILTI